MIEQILHFLGLCPDAHSHLNLMDTWVIISDNITFYVNRINSVFLRVKLFSSKLIKKLSQLFWIKLHNLH
jgi:hypothetical protein